MKVLLLSGGKRLASQPVLEVVHELVPQGVEVQLASWAAASQSLHDAVPVVVWGRRKVLPDPPAQTEFVGSTDPVDTEGADQLEPPVEPAEAAAATEAVAEPAPAPAPRVRPTGLSKERLKAAYAWRALRVRKKLRPYKRKVTRVVDRLKRTGRAGSTWRRLRADDGLMAFASGADVIIALDQPSVLAAWKLARRLPEPDVVYGLSAGRGVVMRRLEA